MDLDGDAALVSAFKAAATALQIPLKTLDLSDPGLVQAYGCNAILVRPDQFVAWVGHDIEPDAKAVLTQAIAG